MHAYCGRAWKGLQRRILIFLGLGRSGRAKLGHLQTQSSMLHSSAPRESGKAERKGPRHAARAARCSEDAGMSPKVQTCRQKRK